MRYFKSLLLLLFCCLSLAGQSQDAQLMHLTEWTIEDGQMDDFIEQLRKIDAVYREKSDFEWEFNRYDDNTIEVVMPIKSYADLDRQDAQFAHARASLSEEDRNNVYDADRWASVVKTANSRVVATEDKFRYRPGGKKINGSEMKASRLERYTVPYRKVAEMEKHIGTLIERMTAVNSPLAMTAYHNEYGPGTQFEIIYLARDRAEMDRQLAEHNRLMAGPEYDRWKSGLDGLVTDRSATTGVTVEGLGQQAQPRSNRMYLVQTEHIQPGKLALYKAAKARMNQKLREADADLYWVSHLTKDNRAMHFLPIENMDDLDEIREGLRKRSYQISKADQETMRAANEGVFGPAEMTVWVHHPSMSYLQEQADEGGYDSWNATIFEYDVNRSEEVLEFIKQTKEDMASMGQTTPYEIWTYAIGGPSNQFLVAELGKDRAALEASLAADRKAGGKALETWTARMKELLTVVEEFKGDHSKVVSYQPETK